MLVIQGRYLSQSVLDYSIIEYWHSLFSSSGQLYLTAGLLCPVKSNFTESWSNTKRTTDVIQSAQFCPFGVSKKEALGGAGMAQW